MPEGVEIPISHEQPKSTLESLLQIKKEFDGKLAEAVEKNDSSKKRRYQRQLKVRIFNFTINFRNIISIQSNKQFEDGIKAIKENKPFNFEELKVLVPPGFAQIPLQNGRPISTQIPSSHSSNNNANTTQQRISSASGSKQQTKKIETYDNDDDDLINQLENEIDDDDLGDDGMVDPEEEKFNQQIKAASKFIPKNMLPSGPPPTTVGIDSKMLINDPFNSSKQRIAQPAQPQVVAQPKPQRPQQQQQQPNLAPKQAAAVASRTGQSKELTVILERQRLFREAALKAKQDGNQSVALVYLRHAKGFDTMIAAAENGLPLDMNNVNIFIIIKIK
jgi:hypothetical protein